jgi:dTDP-4-dehydrorhamnose 3,5-epimerase-like enzyme
MSQLLFLDTFSSDAGDLTVFEGLIPGSIKRAFFIQAKENAIRGGHRHHKTWQVLSCISGSCRVINDNGQVKEEFILDCPQKCLILSPEDWHIMDQFTENSILLVLANEFYDQNDYIYEPYEQSATV